MAESNARRDADDVVADEDTLGDEMNEPLLSSSFTLPYTPIQHERTTGSWQEDDGLGVTRGDDDDDAGINRDDETIRMLGRSYASGSSFWLRNIPLSVLLGVMIGLWSALFLNGLNYFQNMWPKFVGHWSCIAMTVAGGLISSLFLILPGGPITQTSQSPFVRDLIDVRGNISEAPYLVASSFIALASGAPLGPEVALGALGAGVASFLAHHVGANRRTSVSLVQSSLAGSLGLLFHSPLVGVTMTHEVSACGRPIDLLWDAVAIRQRGVSRDVLAHQSHDYMEQLTQGGILATTAFVVLRCLLKNDSTLFQVFDLGDDEFRLWYFVVPLLIGFFVSKTGALLILLTGTFKSIRKTCSQFLIVRYGLPQRLVVPIFPIIACAFHGLLLVWKPILVGSGMEKLTEVLEMQVSVHDVPHVMLTALMKLVTLSMCRGFGLMGGTIFPMLFVGACMGMALSPMLPPSLTVPACMAASVVSSLPIPFAMAMYVTCMFSLSFDQMTCVFVTSFVSFTFVGGIGFVKRTEERRCGITSEEIDIDRISRGQAGYISDDDASELSTDYIPYEALRGGGGVGEEVQSFSRGSGRRFGGISLD